MLQRLLNRCAALKTWQVIVLGIALAAVIEGITVFLRYGLHWQSTRDTASTIGVLTLGLRVHHGYIGVFVMLLGWCFPLGLRHALWIVGIGLILSDLAHHF